MELEGRQVGLGPASWVIAISGIHLKDDEAWVQLGPAADRTTGVVLHLFAECTARLALEALAAWSAKPQETRPHVADVLEWTTPGERS
jgi:hypothetical protein